MSGRLFGSYAHYSNVGAAADTNKDAKQETEYDYYLSQIPEAFKKWKVIDSLEGKSYLYLNDSGDIVKFAYAHLAGSGGLFLQVDRYLKETVTIGDVRADLYLAVEGESDGVIVWISKHGGILFKIAGPLSREELITLAEGVQRQALLIE